jgi:hypothetical protein
MRLHLQICDRNWKVVELPGCSISAKKPLFPIILGILKNEKDSPNEAREGSGFYVTLHPEEEKELRGLLEKCFGDMTDQTFCSYVAKMVDPVSSMRVREFVGPDGLTEASEKPRIKFGII